jgi:quinol monooxygenase YgiN
MIMSTLRIVVRPAKRDEILRTVNSLLGPTRVQPGCISSQFYTDVEDPNVLILSEEWKSQADLDRHLRSDQYRKILAVMDMSDSPPDIKFSTISDVKGMDAIRAAREQWEPIEENGAESQETRLDNQ